MKRNQLQTLSILLFLVLCCFACGKKQNLTVSKTEMYFSPSGGMDFAEVEADCDWTVEYDDARAWFSVTPNSGSKNGLLFIKVPESDSYYDRSGSFTVVSSNGKVKQSVKVNQQHIDFPIIHNRLWFLHAYDRWNTDYQDDYIEDSYQHWNYYIDAMFDNWFFYFKDDSTGYQIHTKNEDTIMYAYQYIYYPEGDSLYINFETDSAVVEDYHATIHELNSENFVFSDEYRSHHFEKLYMAKIYENRGEINVNPKKVMKKERGPLIPIDK